MQVKYSWRLTFDVTLYHPIAVYIKHGCGNSELRGYSAKQYFMYSRFEFQAAMGIV